MLELYNLGVSKVDDYRQDIYPISWPLRVWQCFIPENIDPKINVIEKLVLSIVDKEIIDNEEDLRRFLLEDISIDIKLVNRILDKCNKVYFSKQGSFKIVLNEVGKGLINILEEGINSKTIASESVKKIYLFQDAVTSTVVPCFNINELSFTNIVKMENNCIAIKHNASGSNELKSSAVNKALVQWGKIIRYLDYEEMNDLNNMLIPNMDDGTTEESDLKYGIVDNITICSDKPVLINALAYLGYGNEDSLDLEIYSPFGKFLDLFFTKLFNKACDIDDDLKIEVKILKEEQNEKYKNRKNEMDISNNTILKEISKIRNTQEYADMRKAVLDLNKDLNRIENGEDESTNFAKNLRTALEILFRDAVHQNKELNDFKEAYCTSYSYANHDQSFRMYCIKLNQFIEVNRLNNRIKHIYINEDVFKNVIDVKSNNPKDNISILLLYASEHPNSSVAEFIREYQYFLVDMSDLYRLGTDAGHAGRNYANFYLSETEAKSYYKEYEDMVRVIYNNIIKGE